MKAYQEPLKCETCGEPNKCIGAACRPRRFCSRRCANIRSWITVKDFWAKIDQTGGPDACWSWIGGKDKDGYGQTKWHSKSIRAHRLAYILCHGDLGMFQVRHSCDNPPCCNPNHLLKGTQQSNSGDMVNRGRSLTGEKNHKAVLKEADVIAMRQKVAAGCSFRSLAKEFGLSLSTTASAIHGATWKWLPGAISAFVIERNQRGQFTRRLQTKTAPAP